MRVYADTSFLVKLLVREPDSEEAAAEYRRLGRPGLVFLPLHALEAENAIRAKAFYQRNTLASTRRVQVDREETASVDRLEQFKARGLLVETDGDWDAACLRARSLSRKHTGRTGARSLDLLHLAFALEFECELFLSTDKRQAAVATAEGLKVVILGD